MSVGFRVYAQRPALDPAILEGFAAIPAANIADSIQRLCAMHPSIRRMTAPMQTSMVGRALTVKVRPGDNLMIHKAINMVGPGDVIVVSNEGERGRALVGEIIVAFAKSRGCAGFVLDGPMRDVESLYDMGIPMYAAGSTPGGPFKNGPGEINVPISCGGIPVCPGDVVVGDGDGVIVVPWQDAAAVLEGARAFSVGDKSKAEAALAGTLDRSWVDKELLAKKCELLDSVYGA